MITRKSIKRHLAICQAKKELSQVHLTGLALFDYLREYTKDPNPWIQNPTGFFNNYEYLYTVMANQKPVLSPFCIGENRFFTIGKYEHHQVNRAWPRAELVAKLSSLLGEVLDCCRGES